MLQGLFAQLRPIAQPLSHVGVELCMPPCDGHEAGMWLLRAAVSNRYRWTQVLIVGTPYRWIQIILRWNVLLMGWDLMVGTVLHFTARHGHQAGAAAALGGGSVRQRACCGLSAGRYLRQLRQARSPAPWPHRASRTCLRQGGLSLVVNDKAKL